MTRNLEYREEVLRLGYSDPAMAEELWIMSSRDPLFWMGTFLWTYSPKDSPGAPDVPFVPYDCQCEAIVEICRAIGYHDVCIRKSREMGATWVLLNCFLWDWQFHGGLAFGLVSRTEDYVDKPGDPKSLFWKLDYAVAMQPRWLLPSSMKRTRLHLENLDSGSVIDGEACGGDIFRGDRRTAIGIDEFAAFSMDDGYKADAATLAATNCRIFNSTPKGADNAYAKIATDDNIKKVDLHWSGHPVKGAGLYRASKGHINKLDNRYRYDDGYVYVMDEKLRSPWYDLEEKRTPFKFIMAQEHDIDFSASVRKVFHAELLKWMQDHWVQYPWSVGRIDMNRLTGEPKGWFNDPEHGDFRLWMNLLPDLTVPPDREYIVGCDVSMGGDASNSALCVLDKVSGEKVGEFASKRISPHEFARLAVATCRFFKGSSAEGAYLIWERNGPGRPFGEEVIKLGYGNIFYPRDTQSYFGKVEKVPGFYTTAETKISLFTEYEEALRERLMIVRSAESVAEMGQYIYTQDGRIVHSSSVTSIDNAAIKDNHGDRVIADSLAWHALRDRPVASTTHEVVPDGSFARRRREYEEARRKEKQFVWA